MTQPLLIREDIVIDATNVIVWETLTNPTLTKQYMFGCEVVSNWEVGSPIEWKMIHEGKEITPVKGSIIKVIPNTFLEYTVIDPNGKYSDVPNNYLHVTYVLADHDGKTLLTVTQGDYSAVDDGEKRYEDAMNEGGWGSILGLIKKVAEGSN